jgi:hypothetical protein
MVEFDSAFETLKALEGRGVRSEDLLEFNQEPGKQHYRLLSQLASHYTGKTIIDIGTHKGSSAFALSITPETACANKIISFDIVNNVSVEMQNLLESRNVVLSLDNLMLKETRESPLWKPILLESAFIFLDIDPHEGSMEYEFYLFLRDNDYKGFVICDDIWYFKGMRDNFWYKIPLYDKLDVTDSGHWSGTGILFPSNYPLGASGASDSLIFTPKWTLVTAYFDLTKCPDASSSIKNRPQSYYLEAAASTMAIPANLVVYCDAESLDSLVALRPFFLAEHTKYIVRDFEDFEFVNKYRSKIAENRLKCPYNFDDRNTPSYYLFCMTRYAMLQEIVASTDELFSGACAATHFAWINMDIERMGYLNVAAIERFLTAEPRDRFSTVYIDYIPESLTKTESLPVYFKWGRCSMCSGFFTGSAFYMAKVCSLIENKFLEFLALGYGHADEQLYSPVFFENRHLFHFYYGDYKSMVTNYTGVRVDASTILRFLIANSFNAGDLKVAHDACRALTDSSAAIAQISNDELATLTYYFNNSVK